MIPLCWIDVETTGLDPFKDQVLEIAMVFTDVNIQILNKYEHVVVPSAPLIMRDFVRNMHEKNGLLDALPAGKEKKEVEGLLISYLTFNSGPDLFKPPVLAGANPEFDRSFLRVHFPVLCKLLHYRNFDMNTLYMWNDLPKQKDRPHRALPDLLQDIEILQRIKR